MQFAIQSSVPYEELLGDSQMAELLSAPAEVKHLIDVEIALSKAQSVVGMIPGHIGNDMAEALASVKPDMAALSKGISVSGVPVPALLSELRKALPSELAQWLHWGATSQDIVDTASMLQAAQCLDVIQRRLSEVLDTLHMQSQTHEQTLMAARTRTQMATPITLGLRIAQWAQPLITLENELSLLKQKVLRVQLGGAVGMNSVLHPHGSQIAEHMSQQLGLANSPAWHTDRSATLSLANWLLQLCVSLSKMSKDLMIMARSDVGEVRAGTSGGSSTMPHKANPVQSEMVVAMSSIAQALHSGISAASSPVEERDGSSWTMEWVLLPQLLVTTGCALRHSLSLAQTLVANQQQLQATLDNNPQLMSEAAAFALAEHMPRTQAQALVSQALASPKTFKQALQDSCEHPVKWDIVLDPSAVAEPCIEISKRIFAARKII